MKFNVKRKDPKRLAVLLLGIAAAVSVVLCILILTTDLFLPEQEFAELVLYEGPKPVPASEIVAMEVDGHPLFVYDTAVNNTHSWKNNYSPSLSAAPVTMKITVTGEEELGDVVVRPLVRGV